MSHRESRLHLLVEAVADSFYRLDVIGHTGIRFDFFAEPADDRHNIAVIINVREIR